MTIRLCTPGVVLRDWINHHYPDRDKRSDGWIGDAAHAARPSDHNPDTNGIVHAIDIDKDLNKRPDEAARLAETLRLDAKTGRRPITYIIYAGRISSPRAGWKWRPYDGINPHHHHIHISFRPLIGE